MSEQERGRTSHEGETPDDHPHTVVILERDGMTACYVLDTVDSMGFHLTRYVDGEPSHQESLTWNEAGRMIRNSTMRVYDMTDEEVANLD